MSSNSFTFVDELPERQGRTPRPPDQLIADFAQACKDNPGRWCVYPKPLSASTRRAYAAAINHGRLVVPTCLGTGEFEATTRDGHLWVRCKPTENTT